MRQPPKPKVVHPCKDVRDAPWRAQRSDQLEMARLALRNAGFTWPSLLNRIREEMRLLNLIDRVDGIPRQEEEEEMAEYVAEYRAKYEKYAKAAYLKEYEGKY